jgi:hypothetical protein
MGRGYRAAGRGRGAWGCRWCRVTQPPKDTMSHPHTHCSSTFTQNLERNNLSPRMWVFDSIFKGANPPMNQENPVQCLLATPEVGSGLGNISTSSGYLSWIHTITPYMFMIPINLCSHLRLGLPVFLLSLPATVVSHFAIVHLNWHL